MTIPGCFTAIMALSVWLGALAIGQRLDRTLAEADALALSTPELAAECARLQATVDRGPMLQAELAGRRETLARSLTILPRPEVATPEYLLERMQTCSEAARFQMKTLGGRPGSRAPSWRGIGDFREIEITTAYEGTLSEFVRLLSEVERTESFVRVNSFSCSVGRNWSIDVVTEPMVHVALNVSTFRFEERAR